MAYRMPWGLLVLLLLVGDAWSLWWLYGTARDADYNAFLALVTTVAYVFAAFIVGVLVLRVGGVASFGNVMRSGLTGGVDKAMLDGLLVLVAALLIMWPGLVSDALALVLLFPLTRAPIRAFVRKRAVFTGGGRGVPFGFGRGPAPGPRVEREREDGAVDVDDYRVE